MGDWTEGKAYVDKSSDRIHYQNSFCVDPPLESAGFGGRGRDVNRLGQGVQSSVSLNTSEPNNVMKWKNLWLSFMNMIH
jgi:hypothetical protein